MKARIVKTTLPTGVTFFTVQYVSMDEGGEYWSDDVYEYKTIDAAKERYYRLDTSLNTTEVVHIYE